MIPLKPSEKGQAIVVVAVMIVVLLGLTALAIDGGMIYSDRRDAQNAADSAALAGALEKANGQTNYKIMFAMENSLSSNGYDVANASRSISPIQHDYTGDYYLITVGITDTTKTYFAQMFARESLTTRVYAVSKVRISEPYLPGMAIIAMSNCVADGDSLLEANGGGNSGGIETHLGGMFTNSPENAGNHCAIDPPSSGDGIKAYDGFQILSVGSYNYGSVAPSRLSPLPVVTNINGGVPIGDPYPNIPMPLCPDAGYHSGSTYYPGRYGGPGEPDMDWGNYQPGIYCITGDLDPNGNGTISGAGVVFYFIDGGMNFTGQADLQITAPVAIPCTVGGPTDRCTYNNIAIIAARDNDSQFRLTGNGVTNIQGLVYTLSAHFVADGGGNEDDEFHITGQLVCASVLGNGNGTFKVKYDAYSTVKLPVQISLVK